MFQTSDSSNGSNKINVNVKFFYGSNVENFIARRIDNSEELPLTCSFLRLMMQWSVSHTDVIW